VLWELEHFAVTTNEKRTVNTEEGLTNSQSVGQTMKLNEGDGAYM